MKYIALITFLFCLNACSQKKHTILGEEIAKEELKDALSNKPQHNVLGNNKIIIKDSNTAIKIAEPILFDIYGEKHIKDERPYEAYLLNTYYWVLSGTLPEDSLGGTFLIIIDARNSKIIKLIHGK